MGKVVKAVSNAVGGAVKTVKNVAKSAADSSLKFSSNLAKGNISKALSNVAGIASMGTIDTSGRNKGIINPNKYVAGAMGASGVGSVIPATYKSGKSGLLAQLRQGKGMPGGGSYTEAVKNPLGGTAGKTGK